MCLSCDAVLVAERNADGFEGPGRRIVRGAFTLASRSDGRCRPVHLLYALADTESAIGKSLSELRQDTSSTARASSGATSTYVFGQTQRAAADFAAGRSEPLDAPHLLIALLDQHDAEVDDALTIACIDAPALRRTALTLLGAPTGMPAIAMPPLTPAGTMDRPALDMAQLDPRAWRVLTWRQDHLPLGRIQRSWHADALCWTEQRAAWRIADQAGADDDQRYSLLNHHEHEVDLRLARVRRDDHPVAVMSGFVRQRRRRWLGFTIGWGTWFRNRQVGVRDRWFEFRTRSAYRGQPSINA